MAKHSKAAEARHGLIDSVKGKAKEVVGAVTNNDSLTAEGQFEQAAAKERRAANGAEALADVEFEQARAEAVHATVGAAAAHNTVRARTDAVESTVSAQQAAQKRAAEHASARAEAGAKERAEADAQRDVQDSVADEHAEIGGAISDVVDAVSERQRAEQDVAEFRAEAARLRQQADRIADADDQR